MDECIFCKDHGEQLDCPKCAVEELQDKLDKVKTIAEKYAKASEYYDEIIQGGFVKMSGQAEHLVNQVGEEILEALKGD